MPSLGRGIIRGSDEADLRAVRTFPGDRRWQRPSGPTIVTQASSMRLSFRARHADPMRTHRVSDRGGELVANATPQVDGGRSGIRTPSPLRD
jgi:hypothetical protein